MPANHVRPQHLGEGVVSSYCVSLEKLKNCDDKRNGSVQGVCGEAVQMLFLHSLE